MSKRMQKSHTITCDAPKCGKSYTTVGTASQKECNRVAALNGWYVGGVDTDYCADHSPLRPTGINMQSISDLTPKLSDQGVPSATGPLPGPPPAPAPALALRAARRARP